MNNIILNNGYFLKEINDKIIPFYGNIVIENGLITAYDKSITYNNYKVFDLGGRVVTKPLTNFHEHIYSKLAKGLSINSPMDDFGKILSDYWWKEDLCLTEESIYYSTLLTGIESIKNGIGYIFDHHSSPNFISGSLDIISEAIKYLKLDSVLCFEVTDRNGKEKKLQSVKENFDYISKNNASLKGMIGLHASFTIDDSTIKSISELNKDLKAGIHVHICEGDEDATISVEKYGKRPLKRFLDYNLLNEKSILAHGVKLQIKELEELKNRNIALAINVDSNLNNFVGIHNFNYLLNNIILLGSDGMHSNILKSLKNSFLLSRNSGLTFEKSFDLIKNIHFGSKVFQSKYFNSDNLSYGDNGNLVVWDYIPPTPVTEENVWGHIIYGLTESRAKHFIKNGKFLMKDFNLLNVDEDRINNEAKKSALNLYNKFKEIG
jgi:cytosine/adenosine deaminase-related metal-dependent hydrolase